MAKAREQKAGSRTTFSTAAPASKLISKLHCKRWESQSPPVQGHKFKSHFDVPLNTQNKTSRPVKRKKNT